MIIFFVSFKIFEGHAFLDCQLCKTSLSVGIARCEKSGIFDGSGESIVDYQSFETQFTYPDSKGGGEIQRETGSD